MRGEAKVKRAAGTRGAVLAVGAWLAIALTPAYADACPRDRDGGDPWYPSIAPFEHSDSGRSHAFRCAKFTGAVDRGNAVTAQPFAADVPTPRNLVVGADGARFVYGGASGDHAGAPGGFVARLGPDGREVWRQRLSDATGEQARWNFPGAIGVLANGFLYAANGNELFKINPDGGRIVASATLPSSARAEDSAYNGFNAFSDGTLVAKSVNRSEGCAAQGHSALIDCAGSVEPSIVAVVDPGQMIVRTAIKAPGHIAGRLTTTRFDGVDRLYLVGARNLYRYNWDGETLALDEDWGPVRYILPNQGAAPAAAILGEWVLLQTNARPAKEPMSLVAVNQRDGRLVRTYPWEKIPQWNYTLGSKSFLPSMLSVDPAANRIYVMDGGYGLVAGYAFNQNTGKMRQLWWKKQRTLNFSALVGAPEARVLVASDIRGPCFFMRCLRKFAEEEIVFRNADTGEEIGRSEALPKMTPGAMVTPGEDGALYYLGVDGEIFKITVTAKN